MYTKIQKFMRLRCLHYNAITLYRFKIDLSGFKLFIKSRFF